jgi:hypothetical protein
MSIRKNQTMDMHLQKVVFYSTYVDCLSRIVRELIENGDDNMLPTDLPNLTVLLSKMAYRLRLNIMKMNSDWEFLK